MNIMGYELGLMHYISCFCSCGLMFAVMSLLLLAVMIGRWVRRNWPFFGSASWLKRAFMSFLEDIEDNPKKGKLILVLDKFNTRGPSRKTVGYKDVGSHIAFGTDERRRWYDWIIPPRPKVIWVRREKVKRMLLNEVSVKGNDFYRVNDYCYIIMPWSGEGEELAEEWRSFSEALKMMVAGSEQYMNLGETIEAESMAYRTMPEDRRGLSKLSELSAEKKGGDER